jgi:hypothetical protein
VAGLAHVARGEVTEVEEPSVIPHSLMYVAASRKKGTARSGKDCVL